jgi:predicted phage terminase large subunit-like protein
MNEDGDKYEVFEFPAILNENTEEEKSIWPEQWALEALQKTRASMHHIMWQWYAQYQQNPTASEAAIIKRDWIQWWKERDPPEIDFIVQAYDTALTTKERSDFTVCQTWGVFKDLKGVDNVILLNSVRDKYEFPELKVMALEQAKEWEPDSVIVEAKASGQPLIDEMRRSGIFVQDFSPGKGQDKIARLNAVADMFASGQVWFPETSWASTVVEEILAFPAGEHDDTVDACTLALMRVRKGGMMRLVTDQADNEPLYRSRRSAFY